MLAAALCIVGLTAGQKPIPCLADGDLWRIVKARARVVVIGGLDGSGDAPVRVTEEVARLRKQLGRRAVIHAVPLANPEKAALRFPPQGEAYAGGREAHHLWRWIGVVAPDAVVVVGNDPSGLAEALSHDSPAGVGRVAVLPAGAAIAAVAPSPAREEIERRMRRTPDEVAKQLAKNYGHELPEAVYIPAVAVLGRLRLGDVADVERIVAPYAKRERDSLAKATGSHLAGHLLFAELALLTGNGRYIQLVRGAADLGFDAEGKPKESMPLHSEMSDAVFMGCPILAAAGRLTGDTKYFDMTFRHLRFMQKLDLRADGLYRHSPLDEAAWGRGNAFPALGLAFTLGYLPKNHTAFPEILASFQRHMDALAQHVDASGMWRQVVDVAGSYPELSATCMIGFSMRRGVKEGWLPEARYRPLIDRAWEAAKRRIGEDGRLIDVCTGTGKQPSLQHYLDRPAILGLDPRGGAMALLFATEMR